ncbi:MAG: hypothetical protein IMW93_03140 [Thermoanaerobacteraceae bacterium]|nr:hypothetical protein [Thermoanaerobacteraceae bacterium]
MSITERIPTFLLVGLIALIGNSIGFKIPIVDSLIGMALLIVLTLIGQAIATFSPVKMPVVFWISVVALISTSSLNPYGQQLAGLMNKIDFLAIATPILAYAGLSLGKDIKHFKNIGWKMVIIAIAVYTGTFVCASIIAQIVLKIQGI